MPKFLQGATGVLCLLAVFALSAMTSVASAASSDDDVWAEVRSISCPTSTQCTAVATPQTYNRSGRIVSDSPPRTLAVTFNPAKPGKLTGTVIGEDDIISIGCASTSACVALHYEGNNADGSTTAIAFNPRSPDKTKKVALGDGHSITAPSCPGPSQCIVALNLSAGGGSNTTGTSVVTINPTSGSVSSRAKVAPLCDSASFCFNPVDGLDCPSSSQCTGVRLTAVRGSEGVLTIDPKSGNATGSGSVSFPTGSSQELQGKGVACVSVSQCTLLGGLSKCDPSGGCRVGGGAVTFNPATGAPNARGIVDLQTPNGVGYLACASATRCVASLVNGFLGFDTQTGAVQSFKLPSQPLAPLTCASADRCLTSGEVTKSGDVVDSEVVVVDPDSGKVLSHTPVSLDTSDDNSAADKAALQAALKKCKTITNKAKRASCVKKANARFG